VLFLEIQQDFSPWASPDGDTLVEDHSYDTSTFSQTPREIPDSLERFLLKRIMPQPKNN